MLNNEFTVEDIQAEQRHFFQDFLKKPANSLTKTMMKIRQAFQQTDSTFVDDSYWLSTDICNPTRFAQYSVAYKILEACHILYQFSNSNLITCEFWVNVILPCGYYYVLAKNKKLVAYLDCSEASCSISLKICSQRVFQEKMEDCERCEDVFLFTILNEFHITIRKELENMNKSNKTREVFMTYQPRKTLPRKYSVSRVKKQFKDIYDIEIVRCDNGYKAGRKSLYAHYNAIDNKSLVIMSYITLNALGDYLSENGEY